MLLLIVWTISSVALSQTESNSWLTISNSAQCSAEMAKPAESIFISGNYRNLGILLNNLAKQTSQDQTSFIGEGLRYNKIKLAQLSQIILSGLLNQKLPYLNEDNLAKSNWDQLDFSKEIKNVECLQVSEVNTYYSNLFLREVNADKLTQIAKLNLNRKNQINCDDNNIKNNLDLYPIFNFNIKSSEPQKWQKDGFVFWNSFKKYLSSAWRNPRLKNLLDSPYHKISLLIPVEEQLLILSNGCRSIEKPECQSDYLSSAELRTLFTTDRKKLEMTGSTLEMKDQILKNDTEMEDNISSQITKKSDNNQWIKDFQKSYLGFTSNNIDKLFSANQLYSSVLSQKSYQLLNQDLEFEINDLKNSESAFYLCMEHRILTQSEPYSLFKTDIENMQSNYQQIDGVLKYGLKANEIIKAFNEISPKITKLCNQYDSQIAKNKKPTDNWTNYRPWYKRFISRYKLTSEMETFKQNSGSDSTYVLGLCANSIDCHRKMIESFTDLNKLLLHSKIFLKTQFVSAPLFNENAEKFACGVYDPWESSRLNKKKLTADIASSLLFGWSALPIYLDVNYSKKELVSFNKLVENGHVQFDLEFSKNEVRKSLAVNFGNLLGAPCAIQISEVETNLSEVNNRYVFKGISANACKGSSKKITTSLDGSADSFQRNDKNNKQICGQCSINFEKAPLLLGALGSFTPVGFVIRLASSLIRFNNFRNDQIANPTEFNLNTDYIVDAYVKNNNRIPENCVPMLSRGLSCRSNMCESLVVKEYEQTTGLKVDQIHLVEEPDYLNTKQSNYKSAEIKNKNSDHVYKVPITCDKQANFFNMTMDKKLIQQIKMDNK